MLKKKRLTKKCGKFDRQFLLENLELVSASKHANGTIGETVFTMTVQPEYCNRMGNLHGGAAATVFDICTTTALVPIAREGWWQYAYVMSPPLCVCVTWDG